MRVRLFAALAEGWGAREVALAAPPEATAGWAVKALAARRPDLRELLGVCRLAVNGRYVDQDHPLAAGDELALIPPVSGGSDEGPGQPATPAVAVEPSTSGGPRVSAPGAERFFVTGERLSLDELFRHVARPEHGAVVLFVGITRRYTGGRETQRLEYEAYGPMAAAEMARIGSEAERRWPGVRLAIGHRTGFVPIGEPSVVIAAAAPHRPDAFAAARYAIEELKRRVPIWKKEHYADGSLEWVGIGPAVAATGDAAAPAAGEP